MGTYYFDRKPDFFPVVQEFYRTGRFELPRLNDYKDLINARLLSEELKHWEIELPLLPSKKIKTKALQTLETTKKKVEIFLNCFIRNRMKKKNIPLAYDLYFQSTMRPFKFCLNSSFENRQMLSTKGYDEWSQTASDDMDRLVEKMCRNKYPLFPGPSRQFFSPVSLIMKMCKKVDDLNILLGDIYYFVYDQVPRIIKYALRCISIIPLELIKIVCNYEEKYGKLASFDEIHSRCLSVAFYIYHKIIRGFTLFDADNEESRFARLSSRYLYERGIRSEWRQRKILCCDTQEIYSDFPFINASSAVPVKKLTQNTNKS